MGFLGLLTIIFIFLKAFGVLGWSWFLVFLPVIIGAGIYVFWILVILIFGGWTYRKAKKDEDDFLNKW